METKLARLKEILNEVHDIQAAASLLGWDQQTYMPPGSAQGRGYQMGTLGRISHEKFTSPEVGKLLEELLISTAQLDPDSDDARLVKVTQREYEKLVKVPPSLIVEFAQVTTMAHQVWQKARAENNFSMFQPWLEKLLDLGRKYAEFFAPYDHVYDVLLDRFEPGMKTSEVKQIFNALRPIQVELIRKIAERPQVSDAFNYLAYDEKKQWDFGVEVISKLGYDWNRGRQDKAAHPFTTNFGIDDVRITTRVNPNHLSSALFSSMHECGHALYELGVDPALGRTPLAGGTSLAFHESQSRMWENLVGRSYPFWEYFYPRLQNVFPEQLGKVSLDEFYKGINKVEPSLIRVEADEATYNLHIMLRLELEIALVEGKLEVKDLPEAWNQGMQDYLGITPPDDARGVLQDVHWSSGLMGYFSTYALGNLISLQLWEQILADIPDLYDQFRAGEFASLLDWLRKNIHRHGSKYEPQELIQRITGEKINPRAYINYLQTKFGQIYEI